MELLAPAGNVENFHVALEAGADSVYIGAPQLNARNLARDLSLEEITGMIRYAHDRQRKVYVAVNSLVRETDISQLIKTLAYLEIVSPDALIVQDLGVIRLVNHYFPSLRLHASTLMTAHNRDSLASLERIGCHRVVLSREMTLKELAALASTSDVELEIFIHGAMCFSYSGLCMFSSYFGGKSGLRGNCVQPCRRKFSPPGGKSRTGPARKKSGYIFSMNDLNGLEVVSEFERIGITSLKIEGRLRSANYVANIVGAYRMVLDADSKDRPDALLEASAMIDMAMGRKTSSGYFLTPQPKDAIIQHHSGNIGSYLGRIEAVENQRDARFGLIRLKEGCEVGERLRLHFEKSGERTAFTLTRLVVGEKSVESAACGETVKLLLPAGSGKDTGSGNTEVYRVDVKKKTTPVRKGYHPQRLTDAEADRIRKKVNNLRSLGISSSGNKASSTGQKQKQPRTRGGHSAELWLRLDTPSLIFEKLPFNPDRYVLNLQKNSMASVGRIKQHLGRGTRSVIWALPPIAHESTVRQLRKTVRTLIKSGFRSFQIAHLSQADMFEGENVYLFGDYSLNLLNSQALRLVSSEGITGMQCFIEADRDCLRRAVSAFRQAGAQTVKNSRQEKNNTMLGITVFGSPPLFTSRLASDHFSYGRSVMSPKNEEFIVEKKSGYTQTRAKKSFSLLPYRHEMEDIGINYFVVDLSGLKMGKKEMQDLGNRIANKGKLYRLPTFNYLGTLE